MSDHSDLGLRLDRVESAVQEIRERVARLEAGKVRATPVPENRRDRPPEQAPSPVPHNDLSVDMGLAGISVLILGGAFLLRALTESAALPRIGGVIAGLAYAAIWVWKADRAARLDRRRAAAFHAATASVIAFPLTWETTARFHIISPEFGAFVVSILGLVLLWVAWRDDMRAIAWIANLGAIGAAIAIAASTGTLVPLMVAVTLVSAATLHAVYARGWSWIVWPGAVVSDGLAFIVLGVTALRHTGYRPGINVAALCAYAVIWLIVIANRRLRRGEAPSIFDAMQTAEVMLVGVAGATYVAAVNDAGTIVLGVTLLVVSALAWWIALSKRHSTPDPLRAWFGAIAAVFAACASWLLITDNSLRGIVWAIVGAAAAEAGRRLASTPLRIQSAVWITAAAITGGLLLATLGALVEPKAGNLAAPPAALLIAGLALAASLRVDGESRSLRALLLAIAVCGVFTGVATGLAQVIAPQEQWGVALIRTAVLAMIAILLAIVSRLLDWRPAGTVARAVLVVGGIKLVAEDIRVGHAAMLVAAFAAYGCALLLVSRSSRVSRAAVEPSSTPSTPPPSQTSAAPAPRS